MGKGQFPHGAIGMFIEDVCCNAAFTDAVAKQMGISQILSNIDANQGL